MASKGSLSPGYKDSSDDVQSRERYEQKLRLISGRDPYEIPRQAWKDDVDLWPGITYINPIHPIGNSLKKQKPCTKV